MRVVIVVAMVLASMITGCDGEDTVPGVAAPPELVDRALGMIERSGLGDWAAYGRTIPVYCWDVNGFWAFCDVLPKRILFLMYKFNLKESFLVFQGIGVNKLFRL